jgi:proteasome lid subunit RPN8/RPN11
VSEPNKWLAVAVGADAVRLIPVGPAASGPDVFCKVSDADMLRKDAERLNWLERQHLEELSMHLVVDAEHDGHYYVCGDSNKPGYGPTLRAAIDAAMVAG